MNWLDPIIDKGERVVIGLMSGTSMDGIDAALVRINGNGIDTRVELMDFQTYPYESWLRNKLENVLDASVAELSDLNFAVGKAFADACLSVMEKAGFKPEEVDLISTHGQTVFHNPPSNKSKFSSTLQIGEPDVIAEKTGITTVSDFRPRDISAEGEGSPLVPYVDYILFRQPKKVRILQNIGGIASCTIVTPDINDVIAFDSGPGNLLLDGVMKIHSGGEKSYDKDGKLAKTGMVNYELLQKLMSDDYLKKHLPKTAGRELFGRDKAEELYSLVKNGYIGFPGLLATLVQFTVDTIYNAYESYVSVKWKIDEVILSGGGAVNPAIVEKLICKLSPIKVCLSDKYGIPFDSKEALSFAVLGNETIFANHSNLPCVTGATCSSPLGKISIGKNVKDKGY